MGIRPAVLFKLLAALDDLAALEGLEGCASAPLFWPARGAVALAGPDMAFRSPGAFSAGVEGRTCGRLADFGEPGAPASRGGVAASLGPGAAGGDGREESGGLLLADELASFALEDRERVFERESSDRPATEGSTALDGACVESLTPGVLEVDRDSVRVRLED